MEFQQYQKGATATFKEHKALSPRQARILDWTLGLPGEVGEVTELIKHHIFHNAPLDKMKVSKEIGDILWYIAALAKTLDIPLDDVALLNLAKLFHRHGGTYSHESSAMRRTSEVAFELTADYAAIEHRILLGIAEAAPTEDRIKLQVNEAGRLEFADKEESSNE